MAKIALLAPSVVLLLGCTPTLVPPKPPPSQEQVGNEMEGDPHPESQQYPNAPSSTPPSASPNADAPEITRSVGQKGGVVVLWPRLPRGASDAASVELARRVQQKLRAIVEKTLPDTPVDVRPEPERACPRPNGCAATTLGAIVARKDNACAVVALVSGAGATPQRIVPWAGATKADTLTVPFREPPEPHVKITDFASCAKIDEELASHEADVAAAIRAAR